MLPAKEPTNIEYLLDSWMKEAETQLSELNNNSDKMTPEDRVSYTMDLREDIHDKVDVLLDYVKQEQELLPQGVYLTINRSNELITIEI